MAFIEIDCDECIPTWINMEFITKISKMYVYYGVYYCYYKVETTDGKEYCTKAMNEDEAEQFEKSFCN